MAERSDVGKLSGGDDLGEPSPKRAKFTGYKYSIQRIGNQSDHLFLTNPTFHINFGEKWISTAHLQVFTMKSRGFFTDLNIFYQVRLAGLVLIVTSTFIGQ